MTKSSTRLLAASLLVLVIGAGVSAQSTRPAPRDRYRTFAMVHQGDAEAGKKLFLEPQKIACANCHTVDGKGGKAGPDLFAIGDKFGRDDLIEQVLEPSKTIAVGYSNTIIRTKSGDTFQGIVKESTEQSIGLMGADGKLIQVKTADIDQKRTSDVSLMPEGLEATLTQQQFADLISYLTTLKAPQSTVALFHGQPLEIPSLKTPVALKQINSRANSFKHPVWFGAIPGLADSYLVLEHETGTIWLFHKTATEETKTPFLQVGKFVKGTNGLTGFVFHPKFTENRKYYLVNHTTEGNGFATYIMQGVASPDFKTDSGQPLKEILPIHSLTNDHPGGSLAFGPDGYLYVGMGDSGPQGDADHKGQNLSIMQAKIHRIDVDHPDAGKGYSVPKDNPFVNKPGVCPETWAYGLREPWRFSFDPLTGDFWVADIGQDLYEEIDIVHKGENYGWSVYEGFERFSNKTRRDNETYVPPLFTYTRKYGQSVTGGYVYRANPKSSFYGAYIFGDYQQKRLFALTQKNGSLDKVRVLTRTTQSVVSIGQDAMGEIYYVGYEGNIYKLDLESSRFE
ncbi:MAG TPA: PQQ-dependent sugar dehydrogenase [Tepidisphaeraceae bacterium]|jgi:putative heme-binding domain-containing protein